MPGNPIDDRETCELETPAALPPLPPGVAPGALVLARAARWRVDASVDRDDCRELHLRATADGARRVLLWPFDRPAPLGTAGHPRVVTLRRWTAVAARALQNAADPRAPRGTFTGAVLPYQLAPAIAMASGIPRLLLADEVGLGKTIQAGWILSDLAAREPGARCLVAVPAALRDQWASELSSFFALAPARVDSVWLRAAVADRPADVSPWAAPGVYLGSIDFLKRADVARSIAAVIWDVLVVDEAHGAVAPSERHAALAAFAGVSRRVVLITATPYSGDAAAFSSLTSLGAGTGDPPPLMFRRSRDDVGDGRARRHRFTTVRIGRDETRLQRLLERYTRDVWRSAPDSADGARLAMTILRKRALSSPSALLRSLTRRLELLRGTIAPPAQLSLFEDPLESDDALPDAALAAPGLADASVEERRLTALIDAAALALTADSKARRLVRLLSAVRGESAIVFTEYRDTLHRLATLLPDALHLHGGLSHAERGDVQRRFNTHGGVLLATDAAADGLNLQQRCRLVVNFELPWNPARLEQRIGRVDRIGQRRVVHAVTFVARDTAEDLVVARLARRLARVAATLGERDRLASLGSDVRTARAVIAGAPLEIDGAVDEAPRLPRASSADFDVDRIAPQAGRSRATVDVSPAAVARLRASRFVEPGVVAVLCAAVVEDRGVVAERAFIFHMSIPLLSKPRSQREALDVARAAIEQIQTRAPFRPEVRDWMESVMRVHDDAVTRRIAREQAIRHERPGVDVQPGLFDARALRHAIRLEACEDERRREHDDHLRALEASRAVRLECRVAALLTVWR